MMRVRPRDPHDLSLWELVVPPTIWALHFLTCYVMAAVYCAKRAPASGALGPVRLWIAGLTAVALGGILLAGWRGWHRWSHGEIAQPPHDADTIEDRTRFVGLAMLLLTGLSFVATVYSALPALVAATCR
jgi:hypothetical protein